MSKRKALAQRTPSGQLSRAGVRDYSPAHVRAFMAKLVKEASNPLAGYEVGRLFLAGHLTEENVNTASRYRDLARSWMAVAGVPSPNAQAMDLSQVKGKDNRDFSEEQAAAIKAAWIGTDDEPGAWKVLVKAGGRALADQIYNTIMQDMPAVTSDEKKGLRFGLEVLGLHWARRRR
jgi:hypothetical protein